MLKSEIINKIYSVLSDKFFISREVLTPNNLTESLFGSKYKMDAIALTYFFLELQKEFNIRFDSNDIVANHFTSIDSISSIIIQSTNNSL